jgi:hypothetical protein
MRQTGGGEVHFLEMRVELTGTNIGGFGVVRIGLEVEVAPGVLRIR